MFEINNFISSGFPYYIIMQPNNRLSNKRSPAFSTQFIVRIKLSNSISLKSTITKNLSNLNIFDDLFENT